jgi:hypothetical protein
MATHAVRGRHDGVSPQNLGDEPVSLVDPGGQQQVLQLGRQQPTLATG